MKQVTRKALSLLLSFAMLFSMTQGICTAPAFAATPVSISGVAVDSGDWYAQTDSSGTVMACGSTGGWNIHVVEDDSGDTSTATITLKNAVIDNSSGNDAISVVGYDLKIELVKKNTTLLWDVFFFLRVGLKRLFENG